MLNKIKENIKFYFLNEKFFTSILLTFMVLFPFQTLEIYKDLTREGYVYVSGRDLLFNGAKLTSKFIGEKLDTDELDAKLYSGMNDRDLSLEERYFAKLIYIYHYPNKLSWDEQMSSYIECSLKVGQTYDLRSMCLYSLLRNMHSDRQKYLETISKLRSVPPYKGLLEPLQSEDEIYMNLYQLCFDTSVKGFCTLKYGFLLSEVYRNKDERAKVIAIQNFRRINNEIPGISEYLETNWVLLKQPLEVQKMLELSYRINMDENKILKDDGTIDKLARDVISYQDELMNGKPGMINNGVTSWIYFTLAKFYMYKNDYTNAKKYIEKLSKSDEKGSEVIMLFKYTKLLETDKQKFQKIIPSFLKN